MLWSNTGARSRSESCRLTIPQATAAEDWSSVRQRQSPLVRRSADANPPCEPPPRPVRRELARQTQQQHLWRSLWPTVNADANVAMWGFESPGDFHAFLNVAALDVPTSCDVSQLTSSHACHHGVRAMLDEQLGCGRDCAGSGRFVERLLQHSPPRFQATPSSNRTRPANGRRTLLLKLSEPRRSGDDRTCRLQPAETVVNDLLGVFPPTRKATVPQVPAAVSNATTN